MARLPVANPSAKCPMNMGVVYLHGRDSLQGRLRMAAPTADFAYWQVDPLHVPAAHRLPSQQASNRRPQGMQVLVPKLQTRSPP